MNTWKLEDARDRFGELVHLALAHEPQRVIREGSEAVVVLSAEDYRRMVSPPDLFTFLQASPLAEAVAAGEELDFSRPGEVGPGREIDLE